MHKLILDYKETQFFFYK